MKNSLIALLILACACGNILGQAKLDSALVAYYPFNGNANDESGHGYNGTVYGASLTIDRFGNPNSAYSFDGVGDYVNTNFTPNRIFTVSIWYYKNTNQNNNAGLISTYSGGFNYSGVYYAMNEWTDWIRCDGNSLDAFNSSALSWKHIVIVSDGARVKVYENAYKRLDFGGTTNHSNRLVIGDSRYNGRYFKGKIDDIRVYNRALSETEVEVLYQEFKRPPAPLIYMVSPRDAIHDQASFTMTIIGYPFYPETKIQLKRVGGSSVLPASVNFVDSTKLIATFNLQGAKAGNWDLETRNPDGLTLSFPNALDILTILELPLDQTIEVPLVAGRKFLAGFDTPLTDHFYITIQKVEQDWNCTATLKLKGQTVSSQSGGGDWLMDIVHASGTYILEINPSQNSSIIIRAGTSLPQLKLDEILVRKIYRNDGYDWLQMEVPEDILSLQFTVETVGNVSDLDVWRDSFGSSVHWHAQQSFNPPVRLTLDNPGSGTYYLRVYDHGVITGSQVRDYSIYVKAMQAAHLAHDAAVTRIVTPSKVVVVQSVVAPQAMVHNVGLNTETIPVHFQIGLQYNESNTITLAPGDSATVMFPTWNANTLGVFPTKCYTSLSNDGSAVNDTVNGLAAVLNDLYEPAIFSITPNSAGNLSTVLVRIEGQGFQSGATVRLAQTGLQDIYGLDVTVLDAGHITTSFDLNGSQLGNWDVVVTNSGNQIVTLTNGFSTEEEGCANLWVGIIGRGQIRAGRESAYSINYGNRGKDLKIAYLFVKVPREVDVKLDINGYGWVENLHRTDVDGTGTATPIMIQLPFLKALDNDRINMKLKTNSPHSFKISVGISEDPRQILQLPISYSINTKVEPSKGNISKKCADCDISIVQSLIPNYPWKVKDFDDIPPGRVYRVLWWTPGGAHEGHAFKDTNGQVWIYWSYTGPRKNGYQRFPVEELDPFLRYYPLKYIQRELPKNASESDLAELIREIDSAVERLEKEGWTFQNPGDYDNKKLHCAGAVIMTNGWIRECIKRNGSCDKWGCDTNLMISACLSEWEKQDEKNQFPLSGFPENPGVAYDDEDSVNVVYAFDPNEKVGSQGIGIHRAISLNHSNQYLIYFENLDGATAAAQEVEVLDTLDTDLDWNSFSFDDLQIGDTTIVVNNLGNAFTKIVPWNDTTEVRTSGTFDPVKGIVRWYLRGTDSRTGDYGDFLPPNITSPQGEGHVGFTIKPKSNLTSGTQIKNRASIVFDVNPAMVTNEVFNTIDADAPTSRVLALNTTQTSNEFEVRWSGSDVGSGIKDYAVFVATNGGPYSVWLASTIDTSATFTGLAGTQYVFYSIARDSVGNREAAPISPDATTKVLTSIDEELPVEFTLMHTYPNPFNLSTTIRFDVPRLSHVKIKIYDILGREVLTLVDRKFEAGRFIEIWNGRNNNGQQVASGLYFMCMHADKFLKVRKLILLR